MINLALPEKDMFSLFSNESQDKIKVAREKLRIEIVEVASTKNDDDFVILYAFYKDVANTNRFPIPPYKEMHKTFVEHRESSYILFALLGDTPVAAAWTIKKGTHMEYIAGGSIMEGLDLDADYFLIWSALKLGKKLEAEGFDLEPPLADSYPKEKKRWSELEDLFY